MKVKEIAKLLANRVNQEHYILHYMNKIYLLGLDNGKKEQLNIHTVIAPLCECPKDRKIGESKCYRCLDMMEKGEF